ncbi:MAG: nucleotidyltransferase substrate binding protein [Verrucomicrobia bacterium]|nr:nucleotidyltransferase substrate binding protein [Verrucomicrobiota bacterium]
MNPDIRWKQRFQNYDHAWLLLRGALENGPSALNRLETEGVIQRFEYTFELAWKVMKDFLEAEGTLLPTATPKAVIKEAFAAKVIPDGQVWVDMLNHRNLLSHTHDFSNFEGAVVSIVARYLPAMGQLHAFLESRQSE